MLVPPATLAEAHATTSALVSTDLPFFPAVSTQTSMQSAVTGESIHDTLDLSRANLQAQRAPNILESRLAKAHFGGAISGALHFYVLPP